MFKWNLTKGVYGYFSKELFIVLYVIKYCIIGLDEDNLSTFQIDIDCKDENLPMTGLPLSNASNDILRSHVFAKERTHDFWDLMVSRLASYQGTILSLYTRGRVLRSLTRLPNRRCIYMMETIQQELLMNVFYHELDIKQCIFINIFKCHISLYFIFAIGNVQ